MHPCICTACLVQSIHDLVVKHAVETYGTGFQKIYLFEMCVAIHRVFKAIIYSLRSFFLLCYAVVIIILFKNIFNYIQFLVTRTPLPAESASMPLL